MVIMAGFARSGGQVTLEMTVENQSTAPLDNFMIQFDKNTFGLQAVSPNMGLSLVQPGSRADSAVVMRVNPGFVPSNKPPADAVQCAVKNSSGQVFYFSVPLSIAAVSVEGGRVGKQDFLATWKDIPDTDEVHRRFDGLSSRCNDIDAVERYLEQNNVFTIAQRQNQQANTVRASCRNSFRFFADVCCDPRRASCTCL